MSMPRGGGACTGPGPLHVFSISLGSVHAGGRVHTRTKQRPKPPQPPQAFSRKCVLFFVSLVDEMMTS